MYCRLSKGALTLIAHHAAACTGLRGVLRAVQRHRPHALVLAARTEDEVAIIMAAMELVGALAGANGWSGNLYKVKVNACAWTVVGKPIRVAVGHAQAAA